MNLPRIHKLLAAAFASAAMFAAGPAAAQLADIADVPLAQSPSTSVLPNLMYVLDDSGSMAWNWMPDQIFRTSASVTYYHCRRCQTNTIKVSSTNTSTGTITFNSTPNPSLGARQQLFINSISGSPSSTPAPLALNTPYWLRSPSGSTTKLEDEAGNQISLTTAGQGTVNVSICSYSGGGDASSTPNNGFPCGNDTNGGANSLPDTSTIPLFGDPPYYAHDFNKIWYNPDITYSPAVDYQGNSLGNSSPTAAKNDFYTDPTTVNLANAFQELIYCTTASPTSTQLTDTTVCRYNGKHNTGSFVSGAAPAWFLYNNFTVNNGDKMNMGLPYGAFANRVVANNSPAIYYEIQPQEFCSDVNLTTCVLATGAGTAPDSVNTIAAPVRWCKTLADTALKTAVTGTTGSPATARCRKKFDKTNYPYPRFGRFIRHDVVSTTASYPKSATSTRSDCASPTFCTYAEEIQNYANWYSYYRFRLSLMKTATGKAFLSIDDRFRVGFITINPNSPVTASKFVAASTFNSAQRNSFYSTLYSQSTNGGTPLREALSRVGRYYGGLNTGINSGMTPDPMQYSCQTNYALLTTDGYWNGNAGQNLSGSSIGNQDNSNTGYSKRSDGAYDGNLSGASDTLADTALYYYKTDLRTSGTLAPNNVPTNNKDTNNTQHMVTFTLGLGLEGFMDYIPDYETSATGDFAKIKSGTTGCSWTTGTCDWPVPTQNEPSTLDDLWHAAVNGRGNYFSASDPNSLALGLQSALAKLKVATAAASASATSSPNITQTDNFIFSSTFRTGMWDGEIIAQRIDVNTGLVLPAIVWSAQAQLDTMTSGGADSRVIFTIDESGGGRKKPFQFGMLKSSPVGLIAAEQPYFANQCGVLAQCSLLTTTQKAVANSGDNLVNWLRGQRQYESFNSSIGESIAPFRTREHVLGDPINATPDYVANPTFRFSDAVLPTYDTFQAAQASRTPVLYIASNEGMLHAFDGNTGIEKWAYVPRITMPMMPKIANANWSATHKYSVDGSPQAMDAYFGGNWHTVLVAGLNGGGRGYYALDVTDPNNPSVLWEACADPTLCQVSDSDIGYTFGYPVVSKRAYDGRWVVFATSGINNVSPGTGVGYLFTFDLATGTILSKVSTAFGSTTAPSGLNRIAGYADDFTLDATALFLYGGDLWGNVWRFDTSTANPTVFKLAQLKDGSGKPQSITARPELANISGFRVVYVGTGRYMGEDDLQDPATLTPAQPFAYQQSIYGIKDRNVTYANFRTGSVVVNTLIDQGTTRTTSNNPVNWTTQDGWYLDFNPGGTSPGERVNLDPQLVQGTLAVVTNVPNNTACTIGGDSWVYFFDYKNGTFVSSATASVAGTKFTGEITVGFVVVRLPSGVFKGISTGASGNKTTVAVPVPSGTLPSRRVGWREIFSR